jgi:RHS repeat-associated protein
MNATIGRVLSAAAGTATLLTWSAGAHAAGAPPEGAASAQTVRLPSGPGSVRGLAPDPTVDQFSAQARYEVPLELPRAPHGFTPQLALSYHGELGNGPLGIGWHLGSPLVRRATYDGVPSYGTADVLELVGVAGGGRLVALGAGAYRVEGQGNLIRVREVSGGFEVTGPDGTIYRLGTSAASRHDSGARVAAWMAEDITDLAGQRIRYTYQKDAGQIYLTRVSWGPDEVYTANLELGTRPDRTRSWRTGFAVTTGKRVDAIRVEAFGQVQRRYELGYDATFTVSRLATVRMVGRPLPGQPAESMPVLTFGYAARGSAAAQPLSVGTWRLDATTVFADIDGDGAADLVQLGSGNHRYRQNRGGSFGPEIPITGAASISISTARLADVEGRSRPNLISVSNATWFPYRVDVAPPATPGQSPTATWRTLPGWNGESTRNVPHRGNAVVLADLTGDGRIDTVQWNASNLTVRAGVATGLAAGVTRPLIAGTLTPNATMRWQDLNGDGLADILALGSTTMLAYLGHGDGTFEPAEAVAYPTGTVASSDLRFGDLNRDGLLDLVNITQTDARWHPGQASGGFAATATVLPKPPQASLDSVVSLEDANGNGSEDVVWSWAGGMWALDLAGPTNAGMLVSVANGLGSLLSIEYAATTAIAGAAADAGTPWTWHLPVAIPVVTRTTTSTGPLDPPRVIDYVVRDGFWDAAEHRFGGFLSSRLVNRGDGGDLITDTTFHSGTTPNRVLRGRPVRVVRSMVSGGVTTPIDETINTWLAKRVTTLPSGDLFRRAVLTLTQTAHHEGRPAGAALQTRTTYVYDGEARNITEIAEGRLDLAGDDRRIERGYASDETLWVRDLPSEEKTLAADGTVAAWTQTFYGDHLAERPLGQAGRGWQRRIQGRLTAEDRWVDLQRWDYDAVGNPIRTVEGNVVREVDYDARRLFAREERLFTGAESPLRWKVTWDEVLGVPQTIEGPDGIVLRTDYDSLGRAIANRYGTGTPHAEYRYFWDGPQPRTETFLFDGPIDDVTARPLIWSPTARWRHEVTVANGAGETRYQLVRLATDRWVVKGWTERDRRGQVVFRGEAAEWTGDWAIAARPATAGQTLRHDPLGRLVEQSLPTGDHKRVAYGAFTATTTTDGLDPISMERDGQNRIVSNQRGSELARVGYDAAGRVTRYDLYTGAAAPAAWHEYQYDSLGRMVATRGSDIGDRTTTFDDGGRPVRVSNAAGQHVTISYDAAGRVRERVLDDGTRYTLHYDKPRTGQNPRVAARLAWVEEPTGIVELDYDALGNLSSHQRTIDGVTGRYRVDHAASGLPLRQRFDDALTLDVTYDAAGRATKVGDLWTAEDSDPSGRPLAELFGNGVRQTTIRDELGLPARVDIAAASGDPLYGVTITRQPWGAVSSIDDDDGVGLDHSAVFGYDGRGRLTTATIGGAGTSHSFGYGFDDLQNMTSRAATPSSIGALVGSYHYGEAGAGPRQLTSIRGASGQVEHDFGYDAAGRQTRADDATMGFNVLDQLTAVGGLPGGAVSHAYGHDGRRIRTRNGDGSSKLWFDENVAQVGAHREYYVQLSGRVIARVRVAAPSVAAGAAAGGTGGIRWPWLASLLASSGALALLLASGRRRRGVGRRATAAAGVVLVMNGCIGEPGTGASVHAVVAPVVTYFHQGVAPGPELFTDAGGGLVEERRYEPFGEPIDALAAGQVGPVSFGDLDWSALNHQVDPATGWTYHGARWFAPETARWLAVDPPTLSGDVKYAGEPWALHPYQYTDQNPILYWDPDGREKHAALGIMPPVPTAGRGSLQRTPHTWEVVMGLYAPSVTETGGGVSLFLAENGVVGTALAYTAMAAAVVYVPLGIGYGEYAAKQEELHRGQLIGRAYGFLGGFMEKYKTNFETDGMKLLWGDFARKETSAGGNRVRGAFDMGFNQGLREGIAAHLVVKANDPAMYQQVEAKMTEECTGYQPLGIVDALNYATQKFYQNYQWTPQ